MDIRQEVFAKEDSPPPVLDKERLDLMSKKEKREYERRIW